MIINNPATAAMAFPEATAAMFVASERNMLIGGHATCEAWRVGPPRRASTSKNSTYSSPARLSNRIKHRGSCKNRTTGKHDMKVGILAGGLGSRLSEETVMKPKPMVEIGGRPILWHIMMHYSTYGLKEFVVALGYKGEAIKRYMADYCSLAADLRVSLKTGHIEPHTNGNGNALREDWEVDLIDTGQPTNTGGRIKRLKPYLGDSTFMLTWGDGVSNVNLHDLLKFHRSHGKASRPNDVGAVARPPARFGRLELDRAKKGSRAARRRSRSPARHGSTGAFFVPQSRAYSTTSTAMPPSSSASPWSAWRARAS